MKVIVDEAGEIIGKTMNDHTLVGGHHPLSLAASPGKRHLWRDIGEPVKFDQFFKHYGELTPAHELIDVVARKGDVVSRTHLPSFPAKYIAPRSLSRQNEKGDGCAVAPAPVMPLCIASVVTSAKC